jgi:hypothetical protein
MTIIVVAMLLVLLASLGVGWICGLSVVQSGAIAGCLWLLAALVLFPAWRWWSKRHH